MADSSDTRCLQCDANCFTSRNSACDVDWYCGDVRSPSIPKRYGISRQIPCTGQYSRSHLLSRTLYCASGKLLRLYWNDRWHWQLLLQSSDFRWQSFCVSSTMPSALCTHLHSTVPSQKFAHYSKKKNPASPCRCRILFQFQSPTISFTYP